MEKAGSRLKDPAFINSLFFELVTCLGLEENSLLKVNYRNCSAV